MRDARAAEAAPAETAAPAPEAPTAPVVAPAVSEHEAKYAELFGRVSKMEQQKGVDQAELAQLRELAEDGKKHRSLKERARTNPEELFGEIGWDAKTITDYVTAAASGRPPVLSEVSAVEQKLKNLEQLIQKQQDELKQERAAAVVERTKAQLPTLLQQQAGDKPAYPVAKAYYAQAPHEFAEAVYTVAAQAQVQHGVALTWDEAAKAVEGVLAEQYKRFAPAVSAPVQPGGPRLVPTLTNAATARTAVAAEDPNETDDSRMQRAIAALRARK
jgi:hypothetical protein